MSTQQDTHHLSPAEQELLRKKAVDMVISGMKQVQVSRLLGVSAWSVSQWCKQVREKGKKGLNGRKRGTRTPNILLKPNQEKAIIRIICQRHPNEEGLPFTLWTREAIQQLIWKKYRILPALRTLTDYLKRWRMTPKAPVTKAYEQKAEAVRQWLEEEYPRIKAKAKREKALIYWQDEMGLRSDHIAGRSFSPIGRTPATLKSGNRFSCNMISAISNSGKLYFSVFAGSFVTSVYLGFLSRLIRQNKGQKAILIIDGHPVHRGKAVQNWLKEHVKQIECFFLPGYSPELNPDELLNQEIKSTVFKEKRPRNKGDLKALLEKKLYQIQKDSTKIRAYFNAPLVGYAAA
jgi:transposase